MELTNEQKWANRAASVLNKANRDKEAIRMFIYEGIEVGPDGQRSNNGMTGWDGFSEAQEKWLKDFVGDDESPIVK